jgi:hypothetical protein
MNACNCNEEERLLKTGLSRLALCKVEASKLCRRGER